MIECAMNREDSRRPGFVWESAHPIERSAPKPRIATSDKETHPPRTWTPQSRPLLLDGRFPIAVQSICYESYAWNSWDGRENRYREITSVSPSVWRRTNWFVKRCPPRQQIASARPFFLNYCYCTHYITIPTKVSLLHFWKNPRNRSRLSFHSWWSGKG